jgi:hypothetical protein
VDGEPADSSIAERAHHHERIGAFLR